MPSCLPGFRSVWGLISCLQMDTGWMGVGIVHCRSYWGLQLCNPRTSLFKVVVPSADLRNVSTLSWERAPAEIRLEASFPCAALHMSSSAELTHAAGKTCIWDHSCLRCPLSVPRVSFSWAIPTLSLFMESHFKSSQQRQKKIYHIFYSPPCSIRTRWGCKPGCN